jgi:hypothetical protein
MGEGPDVCANIEHPIAILKQAQQERDLEPGMCPKLSNLMVIRSS